MKKTLLTVVLIVLSVFTFFAACDLSLYIDKKEEKITFRPEINSLFNTEEQVLNKYVTTPLFEFNNTIAEVHGDGTKINGKISIKAIVDVYKFIEPEPTYFIPEIGSIFNSDEQTINSYLKNTDIKIDNTIANIISSGIKKIDGTITVKALVNVYKYTEPDPTVIFPAIGDLYNAEEHEISTYVDISDLEKVNTIASVVSLGSRKFDGTVLTKAVVNLYRYIEPDPTIIFPLIGDTFNPEEQEIKDYINISELNKENTIAAVVTPGSRKFDGTVLTKAIVNIYRYVEPDPTEFFPPAGAIFNATEHEINSETVTAEKSKNKLIISVVSSGLRKYDGSVLKKAKVNIYKFVEPAPTPINPTEGTTFNSIEHELKSYVYINIQEKENKIASVVTPGSKKYDGTIISKAIVNVYKYRADYTATLYYNDVVETWAIRTLSAAEKQKYINYKNASYQVNRTEKHNSSGCYTGTKTTPVAISNSTIVTGYTGISNVDGRSLTYRVVPSFGNDLSAYNLLNEILAKDNFYVKRLYLQESNINIKNVIKNQKKNTSSIYDSEISTIKNYYMKYTANISASTGYSHYLTDDKYCSVSDSMTASPIFEISGYYYETEKQNIKDYIKFNRLELTLIPEFTIKADSIYINNTYVERYEVKSPQSIVFHFKPDTNWRENFLKVAGNILSFSYNDKSGKTSTYNLFVE